MRRRDRHGAGGWLLDSARPLKLSSRAAKVARRLRSSTPAKLYVYETILERLAQPLQDVAAAGQPFTQEENPVVRQRHVARHRHEAAADQPRIREGVVGRATRAGRDPRRAVAGEARDAREVGGVDRCGQAR
jgi:hypothetical protein